MKNLYIQCNMGAAGDMLTAALTELLDNPQEFIDEMNNVGIPKVHFYIEKIVKCGITGSHVKVFVNDKCENVQYEDSHCESEHHKVPHCEVEPYKGTQHCEVEQHQSTHCEVEQHKDTHCKVEQHKDTHCEDEQHQSIHCEDTYHEHFHTSLAGIFSVIDSLNVSSKVKNDAKEIYNIIAKAESSVHGREVSDIHFHEVGTYDAIADIVAVCSLVEKIAPDKITCSNICVGNGTVKCAHGILPVPAPATALILKGLPVYSGEINSELCTPTGAAILKYFADEYGNMPPMIVEKIGYGMGTKDFETANCVRVLYGDIIEESVSDTCKTNHENTREKVSADTCKNNYDYIVELCCNIDDMTGEAIGFATEILLDSGALDVYTIPVNMKKSRPGIILGCLCRVGDKDKFINLIFKHTTTIGVRQYKCERAVLNREIQEIETGFGTVRVKKSCGYGVHRTKPEFEDIREIALSNNMSVDDVLEIVNSHID